MFLLFLSNHDETFMGSNILLTDTAHVTFPLSYSYSFLYAAFPSWQPQPKPSDASHEWKSALCAINDVNGYSGCTHRLSASPIAPQLGLLRIHGRQAQDWSDRVERLARIAIYKAWAIRFHVRPATATDDPSQWHGAGVCRWCWCHADGSSSANIAHDFTQSYQRRCRRTCSWSYFPRRHS